ncbi:hypothetical protein WMF39_35440 [Sorangium sp. So ce1504]|uniref:hypothetical protein n=1 Tax=Sorangium sp. So ce1504 TaxID=3133337 RepID=UPI003F613B3A
MPSCQLPQPMVPDGSAQELTGAPKMMKRSFGEVPGPPPAEELLSDSFDGSGN